MNTLLSKLVVKNVKTHKPSYTTTAFISGFTIICFKLLVSGLTIFHYKMSNVSVSDWSMGVGALSALWVGNKHVNNIQINKEQSKQENN